MTSQFSGKLRGISALKLGLLASSCAIFAAPQAHAQNTTVTTATPRTTTLSMDADDTLTVDSGATFIVTSSTAANINGNTTGAGIVITNNGTIQAIVDTNGRAINSSGDFSARNVSITNSATGLMVGNNDAIQFATTTANFAATGSVITINNSGIIRSRGTTSTGTRQSTQAIDIRQLTGASFNLINNVGGLIEGPLGVQTAIASTITNFGTIQGLQDTAANVGTGTGGGEAIRLDSAAGNTVTLKTGSVTRSSTASTITATPQSVLFNSTATGTNVLNVEQGATIVGRFKGVALTLNDTLNLSIGTGSGSQLLPQITDFDTINVLSGDWQLGLNTGAPNGTNISSGAVLTFVDSPDLTSGGMVRGLITNNGTLNFARTNTGSQTNVASSVTFFSPIAGTGVLNVTGTGTYDFTVANTYSGATTIDNGRIRVNAANVLSPNSAITVNGPGILDLNDGTATPVAFSQTIANLAGSGTVKLGANNAATLTAGSGGGATVFSGALTETGNLTKVGAGTLTLSGANTYTGATAVNAGTLAISGAGTIATSSGVTLASGATLNISGATAPVNVKELAGASGTSVVLGTTTLVSNYATNGTFAGVASGTGGFTKTGAGVLTLSGVNTLTGVTRVGEGALNLSGSVGGDLFTATGAVTSLGGTAAGNATVESGASLELASSGTIGGNTTVNSGGTLDGTGLISGVLTLADDAILRINGSSTGTLTTGGLVLNPNSVLNYELAAPGSGDRIQVNGNLTLDGKLNVVDGGAFQAGTYRLIDYTGALTNNGLTLNAIPAGFFLEQGTIDAATGGQVNLVVAATLSDTQFWDAGGTADDGIIAGGSGSWDNNTGNWTSLSGANNSDWRDKFAVFQGTAGTVTVAEAITFTGAQFRTTGYSIANGAGALTTDTAATNIGTDAGVTATIAEDIGGTGGLVKQGDGTLILSGANIFTGASAVNAGTLRLEGGAALADSVALTVLNTGALVVAGAETIGSLEGAGATTLLANLTTGGSNASTTVSGVISGAGGLVKEGSGTLTLTAANSYGGNTVVNDGVLALSGAGTSGIGTMTLAGDAVVDISAASGTRTFSGLTGSAGTSIVQGANNVQVAGGGNFAGIISGTGGLTKATNGLVLNLTGVNSYTGTTAVTGGTLAISGAGSIASSATVSLSGANTQLDISGSAGDQTIGRLVSTQATSSVGLGANDLEIVNNGTTATFAGVIGGQGGIIKSGTGTQIFTSNNVYQGDTTVNGGILRAAAIDAFGEGALITNAGATADLNGFTQAADGIGGAGTVALGAATGGLTLDGTGSNSFSGTLSGAAGLTKTGSGTQTLSGTNSYTGATAINGGTLALAGSANLANSASTTVGSGGTLSIAAATGGSTVNALNADAGSNIVLGANSLTANNAANSTVAGDVSGIGSFIKDGAGTLTLSGANTLTGLLDVTEGAVALTGSVAGGAAVSGGATLAGTGTVGGVLTVADGTIAPGVNGVGTLTTGGLVLGTNSILNLDLGMPGVAGASDRIQVNGNLTLDGTVNATDIGGFGTGVYRIIDYTGTLTDNGLTVGTLPAGFQPAQTEVQTVMAGQVNLLVAPGLPAIQFWDGTGVTGNGAIGGGSASWDLTTRNWTDSAGTFNNIWGSQFAVFAGTAGTVTVDAAISFTGMQFMTDGYIIANGTGALTAADAATNLRADAGVTATIAETIGGTGGIIKNDVGTIILSGANTYSGTTQVAFGTLALAGGAAISDNGVVQVDSGATLRLDASETIGSLAGAGNVALGANTLTSGGNNGSTTFSGVASGAGGLTKAGTGTLTLSGANTFTGATAVSAGTLTLAGGAALADTSAVTVASGATLALSFAETIGSLAGAGNVALGANTLTFGSAADATFGGVLSGTGGIAKAGAGNQTLSGANTYTGATAVNAGTLTLAGGAAIADASAVTIGTGATLALSAAETIGSLAGAGNVALGANTLTSGGNNGSTTFSGVASGTGGLTKAGTGTLTLSGANTYAGPTNINAGRINANGGAAIADTGAVVIASGATLGLGANETVGSVSGAGAISLGAFNLTTGGDNSSTTLAGVVSGTGGLIKAGTGVLTLTGANTFTGATTVSAGTLVVNGTTASATSVAAGAMLLGTGRTGALIINGTLAPGNSIGTFNTNSALTFNSGSVLQIETDPNGTSDRVTATGAVTINGGNVAVLAGGTNYANLTDYTIVSGSAVTGQFNGVTDNLAFLDSSLQYTANTVVLRLLRNDVSFASIGETPNQQAAGGGLNGLNSSPLFLAAVNLDAPTARQLFDGLSGEVYAATLAAAERNAAEDRRPFVERLSTKIGTGVSFWIDGSATQRDVDGADGYSAVDSQRFGTSGGFDYDMNGSFRIGGGVTYARDTIAIDRLGSDAELTTLAVTGYAGAQFGKLGVRVALSKGWLDTSTGRSLQVATVSGVNRADEKGETTQAYGELAFNAGSGSFTVEPFAALAYVDTKLDGTQEIGGDARLTLASASLKTTSVLGGIRFNGPIFNLGGTAFNLDGELAGEKHLDDERALRSARFAGATTSFIVGATDFADQLARVRLGISTSIAGGNFGIGYVGAFSSERKDHGVRLRANWAF